ncbi:hypothetical protein SH661x_001798 [Planctomicrobium sp. SH661]|uniref:hypothetical protein n=1 Tax=Planctomicrobium sp. SH661 TaxID=3448124 RepID=UPI003F5BBB0C
MGPLDFLKRPIAVGSTVVYPVRRGSAMWLNSLKVQQIDETGDEPVLVGYSPAGRRIRVKNTQNCILV